MSGERETWKILQGAYQLDSNSKLFWIETGMACCVGFLEPIHLLQVM